MDPLVATLKRYWGFEDFRLGQREVIEQILEGRSVVSVMPTGAGKSLCYQLPALMVPGCTLVVSPLVALMKDQVDALQARGIAAAFVNSSIDLSEQRRVLESATRGELKLLYVSPERFRYAGAMAALKRIPLGLFAVDEAHCISQWGHDFRPDYALLGEALTTLGAERVAAFTATATPIVQEDIARSLAMRDPWMQVTGFLRENLHLGVVPVAKMKDKPIWAARLIERALRDGGVALVYAATRKHCEAAATVLSKVVRKVVVYHGGLDDEARSAAQDAFAAGDRMVMVATNAFGMGVDKRDVRLVIHWDLPGSVDAYYQEVGRAGRDGKPAVGVLLFNYADTGIHEFFVTKGLEEIEAERRQAWAERVRRKLQGIVRYAYEEGCRHKALLRYFGERPKGCGGGCDRCTGELGLVGIRAPLPGEGAGGARGSGDGGEGGRIEPRGLEEAEVVVVQKVLSAVGRAQGRLDYKGLNRVLRGVKARELMQDPIVGTASFGILKGLAEPTLRSLLFELSRAGCLRGKQPALTSLGGDVMWKRAEVRLGMPPFGVATRGAKAAAPSRGSGSKKERDAGGVAGEGAPALDEGGEQRLRALKTRRLEVARERGVAAFIVASNKLLEQLATLAPGASRDAWLGLKGIGEKNVEPLQEAFRAVVDAETDS